MSVPVGVRKFLGFVQRSSGDSTGALNCSPSPVEGNDLMGGRLVSGEQERDTERWYYLKNLCRRVPDDREVSESLAKGLTSKIGGSSSN